MQKAEFVHPLRRAAIQEGFDAQYISEEQKRGRLPSVVVDLNVLDRITEVVEGRAALSEAGLDQVVEKLSESPTANLIPGFSFAEADGDNAAKHAKNFEAFCREYLPNYIDGRDTTHRVITEKTRRKRRMSDLPRQERLMLAMHYACMLKIMLLYRDKSLAPEARFENMLNWFVQDLRIIPAFEAELAKFCFFNTQSLQNARSPFVVDCEVIRKNFLKGGRFEKNLEKRLNATRDVFIYRLTVKLPEIEKTVLGTLYGHDPWLLTADEALKAVSKHLYYLLPSAGEQRGIILTCPNREREESAYWAHCDELLSALTIRRQMRGEAPRQVDPYRFKVLATGLERALAVDMEQNSL